jgi:hypothetical protein
VMHKFSGMTLSLTFLHASLTEYVLFSGSALDTDGYLGWYTCLLPFSRCFIAFSYSIGDSPYYVYLYALHCGYSGITDKDSGLEWKYWMFSRVFCCLLSRTWP